jgi:hypothetical protein
VEKEIIMPTEKEKKEESRMMIQTLYQAVIGIPDSPDDNGLIGDIKDIKEQLILTNGRSRKNEGDIKWIKRISGGLVGSGGIVAGVGKLTGWW